MSGLIFIVVSLFCFLLLGMDPPRTIKRVTLERKRTGDVVTSFNVEPIIRSYVPIKGYIAVADPIDGCTKLRNPLEEDRDPKIRILLMSSGGMCNLDWKLFRADAVGFDAVLIYNEKSNLTRPSIKFENYNIENIKSMHVSFMSHADGQELLDKYTLPDKYSHPDRVRYLALIDDHDTYFVLWWWYIIPLHQFSPMIVIVQIIIYWAALLFVGLKFSGKYLPAPQTHQPGQNNNPAYEYDQPLMEENQRQAVIRRRQQEFRREATQMMIAILRIQGEGLDDLEDLDFNQLIERFAAFRSRLVIVQAPIPNVSYEEMTDLPTFDQESCTICFSELSPESDQIVVVLSCGHCHHSECINQWIEICSSSVPPKRRTCPTCIVEIVQIAPISSRDQLRAKSKRQN